MYFKINNKGMNLSKNRTVLTKEQKSWIVRNFNKLAKGSEREETRKICERIAKKVLDSKSSISLNKMERNTIKSAVDVAINALEIALKKYEKSEDEVADYIKAATDKHKSLSSLKKKVER